MSNNGGEEHRTREGSSPENGRTFSPTQDLQRESSEVAAQDSQRLLSAVIENKDVHSLRQVLAETLSSTGPSVLTTPSLELHHRLRTPFMAAAAGGDMSIFVILLHAFDRRHPEKERNKKMREQLNLKDVDGMTVLMHAARSCNVAMVGVVLTLIKSSEAKPALIDEDFTSKTVLMHAASSGKAPVFQEIFKALRSFFRSNDEKVVVNQLSKRSGDDRTVLMHAARSGDAMTLLAATDACQKVCAPTTVRHIIYQNDSAGMNLLMHACISAIVPQQPPETTGVIGPSQTKKFNGAPDGGGDSTIQASESAKRGDIQQQDEGGPLERAKSARENKSASRDRAKGSSLIRQSSISDGSTIIEEVEAQPPDPFVPVFKVATSFVQECLWKRQLREQLKATDLWGRSVITHAVNSGRVQLFDAALKALRDEVLDAEVEEMLDTDADEREDTPLRTALQRAGEPMRMVFQNRKRQLKKDVSNRNKLSTIEAKIQSFIPGKLVVIFQLLLAEIKGHDQLYLLIAMSVLAPVFSWGSSLLMKEKPSNDNNAGLPKKSAMSFILSAPAMFFWGVGTSEVGKQSLGWEATTAATALAVATICIPTLDSFFSSKRVIQWWDQWSCQKWRFTNRVHYQWLQKRKAEKKQFDMEDGPEYRFSFITQQTLPRTIFDTEVYAGTQDEDRGTPSDDPATRTSSA